MALVVAGVLSSSPMKSILKRNASEGNIFHIIILHNFEPCYTIPAGFTVKAKFTPDSTLHLPPVQLLHIQLATTGVEFAAAGAEADMGCCSEKAIVFAVEMVGQLVFPRYHIKKNSSQNIPAQS